MSLFPQGNFGRKRKAQNNSPDGGLQGQVPRDKCVSQAAPPQASSFLAEVTFLSFRISQEQWKNMFAYTFVLHTSDVLFGFCLCLRMVE